MPHADTFRALHKGPALLLLPNAWDAGSAKVLESAGATAIATTSAGVAWAHGYADGNVLPVDKVLATVTAIARVIKVPLTIDAEAGYSDDPSAVGDLAAKLVDAGAVGVNIEDGTGAPELLARKITQAKMAAARRGVDLFINARTDVYLKGLVPPPARLEETLTRAKLYKEAGADGLFPAKVTAPGEIEEIARHCGLPMNVLAWPGLPEVAQLVALGVRRLSAGSALPQQLYGRASALAKAFLQDGRAEPLFDGAMPGGDLNALFR
jgi:2-methylisocitrate lyase-like PEP mutase family enzyme